jgi:hypothetical protein
MNDDSNTTDLDSAASVDRGAAEWLERYRLLAERAASWIRAQRSESWLLDNDEIEKYEVWLTLRPADMPAPRPAMLDYIRLSKWRRTYDALLARYRKWVEAQRPDRLLLGAGELPGAEWLSAWPPSLPKPAPEFFSYIQGLPTAPPPAPSAVDSMTDSNRPYAADRDPEPRTASRNSLVGERPQRDSTESEVERLLRGEPESATVGGKEMIPDLVRSLRTPAKPAHELSVSESRPRQHMGKNPRLTELLAKPPELSVSDMKAARARGGTSATAGREIPSRADAVDVSVFAPASAKPSAKIMVQVMLHGTDELEGAAGRAKLIDEDAHLRGTSALDIRLRRNIYVTIMLSEPSLKIEQPVQTLAWQGRLVSVNFVVQLPAAENQDLFPAVRVSVEGAIVGEVRFKLSIRSSAADSPTNVLQSASPRRYQRVFFSYSSKDRKKVLEIAQSYRAAGVAFFQDILDLEPGTRWEKGLYREIDNCDLFLLFWSQAAQDSEWVAKEARYALERQNGSDDRSPDVVPLVLEGPPAPRPPEFLQHLHFDDWMRFAISALGTKPRSRWRLW